MKLIEGTVASIPPGGRKHPQELLKWITQYPVYLWWCFRWLREGYSKPLSKRWYCFSAQVHSKEQEKKIGEALRDVEPDDLVKFGLIPEFVGRLPVIATLEELDEAALIQILTEPKNALTKQYSKLFDMEGVELEFRPDALNAIVKRALLRKPVPAACVLFLKGILLDTMYDIPSETDVTKVVIDESVIEGTSKPLLIYASKEPVAKKVSPDACANGVLIKGACGPFCYLCCFTL